MKVTITIRGVRNPETAERHVTNMLKRSLYLVDSLPGEFGARIDGPSESIELDENREWQRVRDSNSRGCDPNRASNAAP